VIGGNIVTNIVQEFRAQARGQMEERAEARHRSLKRGFLTFFGGYCTQEAIVRNMSPSGARLDFGDTDGVPQEFSLIVGEGNVSRFAKVRWRSRQSLGVQFMNVDSARASAIGK
jgi:hypothetical protein